MSELRENYVWTKKMDQDDLVEMLSDMLRFIICVKKLIAFAELVAEECTKDRGE